MAGNFNRTQGVGHSGTIFVGYNGTCSTVPHYDVLTIFE